MSNVKKLQNRIDELRNEIQNIAGTDLAAQRVSAVKIAHKQSEIFVAASQLTELSTRRIVCLTWFLAILTAALLIVAIIQTKIMVKQDQATNAKADDADKNNEAPSPKQ